MDSRRFTLEGPFIELYKLLKLTDLAASGGEAKYVIDQGQVEVNGETETRKRKKLIKGDKVVFNHTQIVVE